jgi:hypothetical protein
MSDYTVLRAASETLRTLLQANITDADGVQYPDLHGVVIDPRSPEQLEEASVTAAVSLWLYRIALVPDMLNLPPRRISDDTYLARPLPLELLFLITPIHPDQPTLLSLAGRVLQVVDDRPRLRGADLQESLAGTDTELRLSIDTTTLSESAELWYSMRAPFHLSVPVRMQVVSIDTQLPTGVAPPVLSRRSRTMELIGGTT